MRLPRQNQYPKTIQVNGETYTIKWVTRFKNDPKQLGECCSTTKVIRIKKGQTPEERLKTYIHEIIHVFEFEHDLKIAHKLVYSLEEAAYAFLVGNF